jgi:hypothetical protein
VSRKKREAEVKEVVEIARKIVAGGAFVDSDAVRVADCYLWLLDDGAEAA